MIAGVNELVILNKFVVIAVIWDYVVENCVKYLGRSRSNYKYVDCVASSTRTVVVLNIHTPMLLDYHW